MVALFVIVVGCFSIPTILYAIDSSDVTPTRSTVDQLDINNCSRQVAIAKCMQYDSYTSLYRYDCFPMAKYLRC